MGCGHSKINIYPRKAKNKNRRKSVTPEKTESEEEDGIENESDNAENFEDCDQKRTIRVKPFGGPLLAQTEISSSQQDFFKMLDEKIQNGPDYNSECELERAAEAARLKALLRDWEIAASVGSRSLPATPKRRPRFVATEKMARSADTNRQPAAYPIPPSVIHQSYGVTQVAYRQVPNYISGPSHQQQLPAYPSALQYQAISPMYTSQPTYQPPPRQYPSYNQYGSPIKTFINSSPKHISFEQPPQSFSPSHQVYGSPVQMVPKPVMYSNGELQQFYSHHQMVQYQQYKEAREQVLTQNQPAVVSYRMPQRNYQSSVTLSVQNQPNDVLHRKQFEYT